ncbi:hypothetical protein LRS73_35495 (plasmid) [Methylobacterium currus]|uniref:hypothetical protein n=1 Tax=Methylobacterium currus TaxID=2051553 RepID=UPI001E46CA31|nr:hypothetical protein [Methylobacterium currus]UHC20484.1 hypothetical protein LRS73_35495 [Methylobacterium currus]
MEQSLNGSLDVADGLRGDTGPTGDLVIREAGAEQVEDGAALLGIGAAEEEGTLGILAGRR